MGEPGAVVGEHVHHRVAREQLQRLGEVGGAEQPQAVLSPEHAVEPTRPGPPRTRLEARPQRRWKESGQPATVTEGEPDSPSTGVPISSAIRIASSMSVSTICDSGTVLITSPLTKI